MELQALIKRMQTDGFDVQTCLAVVKQGAKYIVIDGHHRIHAAGIAKIDPALKVKVVCLTEDTPTAACVRYGALSNRNTETSVSVSLYNI